MLLMNIHDLELISSAEAAKILDVSLGRLYQLVKQYDIPCKRVGWGLIFLKGDILKFQLTRKDKLKHRRKKQN